MSEAPERIWAWPEGMPIYCSGTNPTQRQAVEYIRAYHVDALLKAEREKALHEAAEVCFAEKWKPKCSTDWVLARVKGHILSLISKDKTDGN